MSSSEPLYGPENLHAERATSTAAGCAPCSACTFQEGENLVELIAADVTGMAM